METYIEMKTRQQEEFNKLPIMFAFNNDQLQKGLKELGADIEECVGVGAGGFMRKEDTQLLRDTNEKHARELKDACKDDDFLRGAIRYEASNHECFWTGDYDDVIKVLALDVKDDRIVTILNEFM